MQPVREMRVDDGQRRAEPDGPHRFRVELGGELPDTAAAPLKGQGEVIGVVVALLILVLAFGSVVGAGLPVAVALFGLGGWAAALLAFAAGFALRGAAIARGWSLPAYQD